MKPNINDGERLIRVLVGIYVMLLGFLFIQGAIGVIFGILGFISFATGATGWCAIYAAMKKPAIKVKISDSEEA